MFDYIEKNIIEIHKYEQQIDEEIKRVKNDLKEQTNSSPWVNNEQPKDRSFQEDYSVRRIPGLGATTVTALLAYDIWTVA